MARSARFRHYFRNLRQTGHFLFNEPSVKKGTQTPRVSAAAISYRGLNVPHVMR
jgi:hypothetical protein